jgi:hypothetical protein
MIYLPLFNNNHLVSMYKYLKEKLLMNAQEYRDLVNKLALLEDETDDASMANGTITTDTSNAVAIPSSIEDQIMHAPTFQLAYAMAKKAGKKKFKWCQCKEYLVKDAVRPPINPTPTPAPKTGAYPAYGGTGGGSINNPPQDDMVPGTYQPDINAGGYTATYMPKKNLFK